jgi:hypothetical protein
MGFAARSRVSSASSQLLFVPKKQPHLLTIAPTGSGKGRGVLIPNILTYCGPALVLDIRGELYQVTARRRRELGHQVVKLDPFRVIDDRTDGLNPLDVLTLEGADLERMPRPWRASWRREDALPPILSGTNPRRHSTPGSSHTWVPMPQRAIAI